MKIVYLFLFLSIFNFGKTHQFPLSTSDYENLKAFFEILVRDSEFAYTLFGNKPCSIAFFQTHHDHFDTPSSITSFLMGTAFETWSKCQHRFRSKNFIIKKIFNNNYYSLLIINKKVLLKLFKLNLETIKAKLQIQLSPLELMEKFISDDNFLQTFIAHQDLLGLILGYGKNNSTLFERRAELCSILNRLTKPPLNEKKEELNDSSAILVQFYKASSANFIPIPDTDTISELCKELNDITSKEETFELPGSYFLFEEFQSPVFIAFQNDPETKMLLNDYLQTRNVIHEAYRDKNILEVTLNQWMRG